MARLSGDLKEMGYMPTDRESPFEEGAFLWSKNGELVCEETGIVFNDREQPRENGEKKEYFEYPNSGKIRMVGGFFGSYDWGEEEGIFKY